LHGFVRRLDLPKRRLRHGVIVGATGEQHHREHLIAEARRPLKRNPLAPALLQRLAIGVDCLLEPRRPTLVFAKRRECIAEIVLRPRPFEWNPLARELLQR
jgi:hypothetical protein